jgi:hypothetical protein
MDIPTLRDIYNWYAIQQQNRQHQMLAQNRMDAWRELAARQLGSRVPYTEQAPPGAAYNYTDSLPFRPMDRVFYQAPGLYETLNKGQQELTPLENMFKPSPPYKGLL